MDCECGERQADGLEVEGEDWVGAWTEKTETDKMKGETEQLRNVLGADEGERQEGGAG